MDAGTIEPARPEDMNEIASRVAEWRLDGENLCPEQFVLIRHGVGIAAFGRIKPYASAGVYELGCVGVVPGLRRHGFGRRIVEHLVARFPSDEVWITTDEVDWFQKLGFVRSEAAPPELLAKIERVCRSALRRQPVAMVRRR